MISNAAWLDSSRRWMVWSSTACSCRAGSSRLKASPTPPLGGWKRVAASVSGVRQACICHHSVKAAIQKRASETTAMNTEVSKVPPDLHMTRAVCRAVPTKCVESEGGM